MGESNGKTKHASTALHTRARVYLQLCTTWLRLCSSANAAHKGDSLGRPNSDAQNDCPDSALNVCQCNCEAVNVTECGYVCEPELAEACKHVGKCCAQTSPLSIKSRESRDRIREAVRPNVSRWRKDFPGQCPLVVAHTRLPTPQDKSLWSLQQSEAASGLCPAISAEILQSPPWGKA